MGVTRYQDLLQPRRQPLRSATPDLHIAAVQDPDRKQKCRLRDWVHVDDISVSSTRGRAWWWWSGEEVGLDHAADFDGVGAGVVRAERAVRRNRENDHYYGSYSPSHRATEEQRESGDEAPDQNQR